MTSRTSTVIVATITVIALSAVCYLAPRTYAQLADKTAPHTGASIMTPSGMVLDGARDKIEAPPATSAFEDPDGDGVTNEIPTSVVDFMEFYYSQRALYNAR